MTIYESLSICSSSMFFGFFVILYLIIFPIRIHSVVCGDQQRFVYYLHLGIFEDKFSTKDSKINSSSCLEQVKSKHLPLHSVYLMAVAESFHIFMNISFSLCEFYTFSGGGVVVALFISLVFISLIICLSFGFFFSLCFHFFLFRYLMKEDFWYLCVVFLHSVSPLRAFFVLVRCFFFFQHSLVYFSTNESIFISGFPNSRWR